MHIYLIEWIPPARTGGLVGLDQCSQAISECIDGRISREQKGTRLFLIGHSLGETLAAIYSAREPHAIRRLLLLDAPLCFQPATSQFRDALVSMVPPDLAKMTVVPGSLLSHASAFASPRTFTWSRLADAAASLDDRRLSTFTLELSAGRSTKRRFLAGSSIRFWNGSIEKINFCRGILTVLGRKIGPSDLDLPILAVIDAADEVAPLASIEPLLEALPTKDVSLIKYPGETA
ncbi:alpha/beta fold hydrolase [Bradyrhizobium sp. CCGUVB23]|uniref:alpha/beta fold hydrolase n=1 Tax=Bradyrhizobium sp. CCGUVB23 TaxID=2949630 RepID=UPI0020B21D66|nr:alpha/beta fold hydrolase [Bradyrhizobium sp. CCGUVB23]MCP3463347.1 alpha/beta fold hydrolase [Bradyrhizobium sp. CCGUVB23]